jgi:uncharacterized membrane protein
MRRRARTFTSKAIHGRRGSRSLSQLQSPGEKSTMEIIEKSVEIDAPVSTVYNQWTQFEEFPRFMEGVKQVRQLDDKRLHWRAEVGGKEKEWDAEIHKQIQDEVIAWRSTSGARNDGEVRFDKASGGKTRVTLDLAYEPEGIVENVGDALGLLSGRVQGDLDRFRDFIEKRGAETGAWRGEIHGGSVSKS